jgi:hypothetical protein
MEAGMSIAKSFTHLELAVERLILIISATCKSVNTSVLLFLLRNIKYVTSHNNKIVEKRLWYSVLSVWKIQQYL